MLFSESRKCWREEFPTNSRCAGPVDFWFGLGGTGCPAETACTDGFCGSITVEVAGRNGLLIGTPILGAAVSGATANQTTESVGPLSPNWIVLPAEMASADRR